MLCLPLGVKRFHLPRLFSLFQSFHSAVQAKPRKTPTWRSAASACRSEQHNCCTSEATNHLRVKSKPFFRQLERFFPPRTPPPPTPRFLLAMQGDATVAKPGQQPMHTYLMACLHNAGRGGEKKSKNSIKCLCAGCDESADGGMMSSPHR